MKNHIMNNHIMNNHIMNSLVSGFNASATSPRVAVVNTQRSTQTSTHRSAASPTGRDKRAGSSLNSSLNSSQNSYHNSGQGYVHESVRSTVQSWARSTVMVLSLVLGSSFWLHSPYLSAEDAAPQRVVNINTADASALAEALQGIGQSRAQEIVRHREAYGPFASPEELMEVKGIGKATLDINRQRITLK